MNKEIYEKEVLFSESPVKIQDTISPVDRIAMPSTTRLIHGAMGLCTEAGEFQDQLKRHIFYGKSLDKENLKEEIGDIFWYLALLTDELGTSFEEIQKANIRKLKARYGEKFESKKALKRNINKEKKALNGDEEC